jgi:hypothetical protein
MSNIQNRAFFFRIIIAALSITAALGIAGVMWRGLGETGAKFLRNAIEVDVASILALLCSGPARSVLHRAVQLTGILSALAALTIGILATWWNLASSSLADGVGRTAAVLVILAIAATHASLVLPQHAYSRPMRILVPSTVLCTAVAAELIANYALFPHFSPGNGYDKAVQVALILDVLGTILILLLHRFGPARTDGGARKPEARPSSPRPSQAKLPAVS